MKYLIVLLTLSTLFWSMPSKAQLNAADTLYFEAYTDTINAYSDSLFQSVNEKNRKHASHFMAKNLTKALNRQNSFQYGFPNLKAVSITQPKDDAFRIFTYQLIFQNNTYKYMGAIQFNSPELVLKPLIDRSGMMDDNATQLLTDNNEWYGALYYAIKKMKSGKKEYYMVFGYDGFNALSTKKVVDVLWFGADGSIKFGAPLFDVGKDQLQFRYFIEYRKGVSASIKYSPEHKKIIVDHLIPENPEGEGQYYTYVPDGSYDGFEWKKGKWVFVEKLFDFKLEDGDFPIGN